MTSPERLPADQDVPGTAIPMLLGCTSWYAVLFGLYAVIDGAGDAVDGRQLLMPPLLGLATAATVAVHLRSTWRIRSQTTAMVITALTVLAAAGTIAAALFALPDSLPGVPGWWNLPAAAIWALLALAATKVAAGRTPPAARTDPGLTDTVWEREAAGHLRLRGRHTEDRIQEVLALARERAAAAGRPLIDEHRNPETYAKRLPAQPGVEARRAALQFGALAGGIALLVTIQIAEGNLGGTTIVGLFAVGILGVSAARSWRRSRAATGRVDSRSGMT